LRNFLHIDLFANLPLKLVAFILAIITWFLVVGEQQSEVRLTVPLELRNLPTDLEIIESIRDVEVTLRGFSTFLRPLTPRDVDVYVDLQGVVKGVNSFVLSADDITVPVGATVVQISPSQITVSLDSAINQLVPVEPIIRGTPADGYILGEVTVKPNTVGLAGAQAIVKNYTKVGTEVISVHEATKNFTKKVKIKLPNPALRMEKEEEAVVEVAVKIMPEMISRFFENIPLRIDHAEKRPVTLVPDSITALLHGPKLTLATLAAEDIPALIETASLPDGRSSVEVTFMLPESVSVKVYYPKQITVSLQPNAK
jgi:YbbR domain-containing protein